MTKTFREDASFATEMDGDDVLAELRSRFFIPPHGKGKESIYLCGNSLGLQPKKATQYVNEELEDWAQLGVEGHFKERNPWLSYHEILAPGLATVVGAQVDEVVAMNSLTVNLHLMLSTFFNPQANRTKVLMGYSPFPSDRYAVASQLRLRGLSPDEHLLTLAPRAGEDLIRWEDFEELLRRHGSEIAVVLLEGVNYLTGQAVPFERVVRAAHTAGAMIGFDLAHAVGNVPLSLHAWGADFAVWCSYKYLNGGPGCVGGCFVHSKHGQNPSLPRCAGWWGHDKSTRFKMGPDFVPIPGVEGWQLSNPPILPLAVLRASLELFQEVGMPALREKSKQLTGYLAYLLERKCARAVTLISPQDPDQRGCQLSLRVTGGRKSHERLVAHGVICDWREPDVIRLAPAPLYNSFRDVFECVEILRQAFE